MSEQEGGGWQEEGQAGSIRKINGELLDGIRELLWSLDNQSYFGTNDNHMKVS